MTDRLPDGFTSADIIRRQLRREFWYAFTCALAWFLAGTLILVAAVWMVMLAHT